MRVGIASIGHVQTPMWVLPILLLVATGFGQNQPKPPRSRPVPQISGRFIDTDGTHSLSLHYERKGQAKIFVGAIHSTCMLPGDTKSGKSEPLALKAIPLGTPMTVYYESQRTGKASHNVILAMRFDRVRTGSALPAGIVFPCFKSAPQ